MYDKLTFAKGLGASLGFLLIVIAIGVYTGVAFAVPVAGVGGYTVAADTINGQDAFIYPQAGVDKAGGSGTAAVVELQSTDIDGLKITKPVDIPGGGNASVVITADDNVQSDEILLKVSSVETSSATINLLEIDENMADSPTRQFELRAAVDQPASARHIDIEGGSGPDVHLEDPSLQTHYLVTNRISLPGLSVQVRG